MRAIVPTCLAAALALAPAGVRAAPNALPRQDATADVTAVREALQSGDLDTALTRAHEAVARHPESAEVVLWLGHAERIAGNAVPAASAYRSALELVPDEPEALMGLAEVLETTGNLSAALETYERAADVAPDAPPPHRAAGRLEMRAGNHARAAEHLARYVELEPDDIEARYLLGMARNLAGDPQDAIPVFEDILEERPDYVPAAYALGVVLADRPEDRERALTLLRQALDAGWEEANAAYLIGRVLAEEGKLEEAVPAFRRALEADPEQLDAHYRLAQALGRLGRRDEARPYMERFRVLQQRFNERESREKQAKALHNRLATELEEGRREDALRTVDEMIAESPDDPATLIQAAKVWLSAGDADRALEAAVAARQLDPADWEANYLEGMMLARAGKLSEAHARLLASLEKNPLFAETHSVLGNVLLQAGDADGAVSEYLAAADLDPDNPVVYLNLATAYRALGRGDLEAEAMDTYRRLIAGGEPRR